MQMKQKDRLPELDALRGLAAGGIMLFHYTVRYGELFERPVPLLHSPSPWGDIAVHLFFIISGFVIFMTLDGTRRPLDFVVSRFSRLYPAYWAAVLITFTTLLFAPLPGRSPTGAQALINLTMLQEWLRTAPVDGVYWTLTIELSFYVMMLALFHYGQLPKMERFAPWCLLAQATIFVADSYSRHDMPAIISRTLLLPFAHLFIAGIVFFQIRRTGLNTRRILLLVGCLGVETLVHGWVEGAAMAVCFAAFFLMVFNRLGVIARPPLLFLGGISYCLYLIHQNVGYVVIRALSAWPFQLRLAAAVVVALGLATLLSRIVEQPALRALRTAYARYRGTRES